MAKIFMSPSKYIQGPGELGNLGTYTGKLDKKALKVAEAACAPNDTIGNLPFAVTPQMVRNAILEADALGRKML